ncbi:hypothetical protein [Streptomyces sp. NPDC057552]|uniref:hypothetical protein n=1 Tax=Streptomyces sp. NPDC057552 TaxID=3350537 RepID=UPI003692FDF8
MSSGACPFTPRMAEGVVLLAKGLTVQEVADELSIRSATKLLTDARRKAGVTTNRALVYVSLARRWIPWPDPGPSGGQEWGELEELVWAGLRFDVLDNHLPGVLASIARTTTHQVRDILGDLRERHQVTHCGLLALGFPLGLLSGREGTHPPDSARKLTPAAATRRSTGPWSGSARTGPWKLTGQQHRALSLLPEYRTFADAAAAMGVSTSTYRSHLKTISNIAGVSCLRSLTHRALQDGLLNPPGSQPPLGDPTSEVLTVWRGLVRNVRDSELPAEIAAGTGLNGRTVHAALDQLRAGGEPDWRLVVRGWAAGVITARDDIDRTPRATRLSARSAGEAPVLRPPTLTAPHASASPTDRLGLLPAHPDASAPVPDRGGQAPLGQHVHVGRDVDVVCVPPDVCRRLLAETSRREWGPVLGRLDAGNALLLTRPGVFRPGWRAGQARLLQAGRTMPLPPQGRTAPGGVYWAVPSNTPLWNPDRLEQLLQHPLGVGSRSADAGGGR